MKKPFQKNWCDGGEVVSPHRRCVMLRLFGCRGDGLVLVLWTVSAPISFIFGSFIMIKGRLRALLSAFLDYNVQFTILSAVQFGI